MTMTKALWLAAALLLTPVGVLAAAKTPDLATDNSAEAQAQLKKRMAEIWDAFAKKDVARMKSFHLYGPKFTMFKDGGVRGDSDANEKGENEISGMLTDTRVDMKDLAVNVYGDSAVVTFNGDFSGKMQGKPIAMQQQSTLVFVKYKGDWKIVHEHFSPIGAPPEGPK